MMLVIKLGVPRAMQGLELQEWRAHIPMVQGLHCIDQLVDLTLPPNVKPGQDILESFPVFALEGQGH